MHETRLEIIISNMEQITFFTSFRVKFGVFRILSGAVTFGKLSV